jgi:predicted nucleic acid-binding Zn ribbon protein
LIKPRLRKTLDLWRGYRAADQGHAVRTASEFIAGALARLGLEDRFRHSALQDHWAEMMGDFVAAHTRPGGLHRSVLTVEVDHSAWLQEMTLFHKRIMLDHLRRRFPDLKVKDIKFRLQG